MNKLLLSLSLMLITSISYGQYYMIPYTNNKKDFNPGNLFNGPEQPVTFLAAPWTPVFNTIPTIASWSNSISIPFSFNFNGNNYDKVKISNSGVLTFDTSAAFVPAYGSVALPSANVPDNSICILGLQNQGSNDFVYTATLGSAPKRQFWTVYSSYGQSFQFWAGHTTNRWTYWAIVLEETSNNINIIDLRTGNSRLDTTSYDNVELSVGLQISSNSAISVPGSPTLASKNLLTGSNTDSQIDNTIYTFHQGAQPTNNLKIKNVTLPRYLSLSSPAFQILAEAQNTGSSSISSYVINYKVGALMAVSDSVSNVSISSIVSTSVNPPTKFTPTAVGIFELKIWISHVNGSELAFTDTLTGSLEVVDTFITRRALHEVFTSSTSPNCSLGNENIRRVVLGSEEKIVRINHQQNYPYSNNDPNQTSESIFRHNYYKINSIPRLMVDGNKYNSITQTYTSDLLNNYLAEPSLVKLKGKFKINGRKVDVTVDVTPFIDLARDSTFLFIAIREKEVRHNLAVNGETYFQHVLRKMLPDQNGTFIYPLSLSQSRTYSFSYAFPINLGAPLFPFTPTPINFDSLEVAAWVQNSSTKEVLQAAELENVSFCFTSIRPTITSSSDITFCSGSSVTLSAPAGFRYRWSNGDTTQSIIVRNSGSYTVSVIDSGCTSANSAPIVIKVLDSVTSFLSATICHGQVYVLGTQNLSLSGIYRQVLQSSSGCDSIISLNLNVINPPPSFSLSQSGSINICANQALTVKANISGSSFGKIKWTRNGVSFGGFSDSLRIVLPGTYRALRVNGSCTILSSDSLTVSYNQSGTAINLLANKQVLCGFEQSTLKVQGALPNSFFTWTRNGQLLQSQVTADTLVTDLPGIYQVIAFSNQDCGVTDTISVWSNNDTSAKPAIVLLNGNGCRGDSMVLSTTVPYAFYQWSTGSAADSIKVPSEGIYSVATGASSCLKRSDPYGFGSLPVPSVCYVSVNQQANINECVWFKPTNVFGIDSVIILREDVSSNTFMQVGKVAFSDTTGFTDRSPELRTNQRAYRYRLVFVDSCGRRGKASKPFTTMFLQTILSLNGGVNLSWTPYQGEEVVLYYIERQLSSNAQFVVIDSMPASQTQYSDISFGASDSARYQIWFSRQSECNTNKSGDKIGKSNVNSVRPKSPVKTQARFAPAICEGRPYNFNGTILTSSDSVTLVLKDRNNLDSIAVVYFEFNKPDTTEIIATTCKDVPYFFLRRNVSGPGTFRDTLRNRLGCDSLMILTLSEYKSDTTRLSLSICEGDSIFFGGNFIKTAGTYSTFVQDKNECDSIIILNLGINPKPAVPVLTGLNDSIMVSNPEGGVTYQWGYNGNAIALTGSKIRSQGNGNYGVLATNLAGCRSASILYQWNGISLKASNMVKVNLYPNPASETVTIVTEEPILSVELTNTLGQKVEASLNENRLNIQDLPKGVYRVLIQTTKGFANKTLVKQ